MEFQNGAVEDKAGAYAVWLEQLPLREDVVEAREAHAQLVRMLEAGDPNVLGANRERLPHVVRVFAATMPTATRSEKLRLCTEETAGKMRAVIAKMQATVPQEELARAFAGIGEEVQRALAS